jgi:argininosuccinate lyase
MTGMEITRASLQVCGLGLSKLSVDEQRCTAAFTPDVFATDRVLHLVRGGVPFRDAYQQVARSLEKTAMEDPRANIRKKTHLGATGNLGLDLARKRLADERNWLNRARAAWTPTIEKLLR